MFGRSDFDISDHYWKLVALGTTGISLYAVKRYFGGKVFKPVSLAEGKVVLITGANTGLGKETAYQLAKLRAKVILACRDVDKGKKAMEDIRRSTNEGDLRVKQLDLASFTSIRKFAQEISEEEERIDVFINNAAVFQCPFSKTEDGLEMQMGVNYFGPFLLTNLLMEKMKSSAPSRIVNVSSGLAKRGNVNLDSLMMNKENYNKRSGYSDSKLALDYFSRELSTKFDSSAVGVHCMSPGMVRTDLGRHTDFPLWMKILIAPFWFWLVKTPYYGCQTILYCALDQSLIGKSGKFYRNCGEAEWPEDEIDKDLGRQLWDLSKRVVEI